MPTPYNKFRSNIYNLYLSAYNNHITCFRISLLTKQDNVRNKWKKRINESLFWCVSAFKSSRCVYVQSVSVLLSIMDIQFYSPPTFNKKHNAPLQMPQNKWNLITECFSFNNELCNCVLTFSGKKHIVVWLILWGFNLFLDLKYQSQLRRCSVSPNPHTYLI